MHKPLDRRTLNRTLLDRQLLLNRSAMSAEDAVGHLIGLQSQHPTSPYPGLWTRLAGFSFDEPGALLTGRALVRIVLMRGTVHLVTAADALRLRPWLQPMLDRGLRASQWAAGTAGVDRDEMIAYGRDALAEQPLGPSELRTVLGARWPDADPASLVNALRVWAPLVQVPPRGLWGASAQPRYALLDDWLGAPLAEPDPASLARRYLAAFGPATPADMQKWSGLTGLKKVFGALECRMYTTEDGRELYDLPDAAPADPGIEVSARYVADFDNLLLSHADRGRILDDAHRSKVMTVNGIVRGTILVDGFVGGTWRFERAKDEAAVVVTPFTPLSAADRDALGTEGLRLLAASDPAAERPDVRFEKAG
ncbi:Winged helix DNA-binding domain-containing protein [Actinacidiphila alni]|uniref:Winged helix DNA-binding domain-containing protein n=1 Tax=Actinacidiphila alni TaxID=380248 RepID=A0A1I1WUP2_9ACTN|nr:winged helix DNA-binding domain-containing protein [Actinacidiphila alni]SFD98078.1 Winged helix DNA-binding domain-containing protein [Actinacidiphila alni]